jgi:hypothetical protein
VCRCYRGLGKALSFILKAEEPTSFRRWHTAGINRSALRGYDAVSVDGRLLRMFRQAAEGLAGDLLHWMEHSPTSATGSAWERTPWHATQRAAWEALVANSEAIAIKAARSSAAAAAVQ